MKFNVPSLSLNKTVNLANGEAFIESPELEFATFLLTSFVSDKFYEKETEQIKRLRNLILTIPDKRFLAQTAIYARNEFGMRSVTHIVGGELSRVVKGEQWVKHAIEKIVRRPDDMTEILAYYLNHYKKPIPNSLKKGLALAIKKFNRYELAKYRGDTHSVKLIDILNLVHPKGGSDVLKELVEDTLRSENTWEVKMTEAGKEAKTDEEKEELKKKAWVTLVKEKKIGYFALLRNLRNIIEQAPEIIGDAIELLTDEKLIRKSLVFPFRYQTAYKSLENEGLDNARTVLSAISRAADIALQNVPEFPERTLVALDCSGSMDGRPREIGAMFAAVLVKKNPMADLMLFDEDAEYRNFDAGDTTLTIARSLEKGFGGGTNFHAIFETASHPYSRIIILSDMQAWIGGQTPTKSFAEYRARLGVNPIVYSFDLNGYGTLQFPERNVYALAGFSDKVFDIMKLLESDKKALLHTIKQIEI